MTGIMRLIWKAKEKIKYNRRGKSIMTAWMNIPEWSFKLTIELGMDSDG